MTKKTDSLTDGVIQSLCYLYQETLKGNLQELANIIQKAIEEGITAVEKNVPLSPESGDLLKQFYVLRGFYTLDDAQKEVFIREIERIKAT